MVKQEDKAREQIDRQLEASGWVVQDRDEVNLFAARGVAVRELPLKKGHGIADYLLFVDEQVIGVLEAKKVGFPLTGVEVQTSKYTDGMPDVFDAPIHPLPFCYIATGVETRFINNLDPQPRSRAIFRFHRPETLAEWLAMPNLDDWVMDLLPQNGFYTRAEETKPSTLRSRIQALPPLESDFLYPNQVKAVDSLEASLKMNKPRALIQMSTGSGKTMTAITSVYRLIKFAGARRVLFLVDRGNLGEQADKEFQGFRTPDDNRLFTDLYNVQLLKTPTIGSSSKVVIATIQRLYSMLKGEPVFDEEQEEHSLFQADEDDNTVPKEPLPVVYNEHIPPEYFDVIIIDECHRSIYTLWRQVLEYFDAFLIGLTATPARHTFGFFNQNLVMEYGHEEAVADGVNVDFEIYKIRTSITEQGSVIEAGPHSMVGVRDRQTRLVRWQQPDQDLRYGSADLDRSVVAKDQIRTIIQTYRDRLPTEIFPQRKQEVPKTLIFAKDDSHAEDIVGIIREEFGKGNDFCQKITYKTTGRNAKDLIQEFRNSYMPRIAVTVDMIATGTDIKAVEVVMFMRSVKSRILFEQMKGRGVRIIDKNDLAAVTPGARAKTHFVIVDCVGITESELADTQPLDRKKSISFNKLLEQVAFGSVDPELLSSLASRLARLDRECGPQEQEKIRELTGGMDLSTICRNIVDGLDPDRQAMKARLDNNLPNDAEPNDQQLERARKQMLKTAVRPLAANPELRKYLETTKRNLEQIIDETSKDKLLEAGHSAEAREKAAALVQDFKTYIQENKSEIDALQFYYAQPYARRPKHKDIKALHEAISAPPRSWTPDRLWSAYQMLEQNRVKGAGAERRLVDIVSLIRFALDKDDQLAPYAALVTQRFDNWMAQQQNSGRNFDADQTRWLEMIRDHVAGSMEMDMDDFGYTPFVQEGGLGKAVQVFGADLRPLIDELNEALAV